MAETYLVGGAVRDAILGIPVRDRDYVVVGSSLMDMVRAGFEWVRGPLDIFIDPRTRDECVLARRFGKDKGPDTEPTILDDLNARDLTINAMAVRLGHQDIIDPHGGQRDIRDRVLRHVSDAFTEDPIRVLRIARLRARLGPDWTIAPETVLACEKLAASGELDELVPERVWKEMSRALTEPHPRLFFDTLRQLGALERAFPEIARMESIEEHPVHHPEGNTYEHTMLVLSRMRELTDDQDLMFAALTHDFGKLATDPKYYPRHRGHEAAGVPLVEAFANRLKTPFDTRRLAAGLSRYHMHMKVLPEIKPKKILGMLEDLGVLRSGDRGQYIADALVLIGKADRRGKLGHEAAPIEDLDELSRLAAAAIRVRFADAIAYARGRPADTPEKARLFMANARRAAISTARREWRESRSEITMQISHDIDMPEP